KPWLLLQHAEDVVLAQNEVVDAVDLDLVARVLPEQDAIALLHLNRTHLSLVVELAVADGDDLALGRLLLRRVGDDDAALRLLLFADAAHENAILQRTDFHGGSSGDFVTGTRSRRVPAREFIR